MEKYKIMGCFIKFFFNCLAPFLFTFMIISCTDQDIPALENEVEIITDIKLIFTPTLGGDVIQARAQDIDGPGVQNIEVLDEIYLSTNTNYILTFEIYNNLKNPGENIGIEIREEEDEHQMFFLFTNGAFLDPEGNGNIDNFSDSINYIDYDRYNNPVGLETYWITGNQIQNGLFKVILMHQPDVKTSTSGIFDGDFDFNLEFVLNIS